MAARDDVSSRHQANALSPDGAYGIRLEDANIWAEREGVYRNGVRFLSPVPQLPQRSFGPIRVRIIRARPGPNCIAALNDEQRIDTCSYEYFSRKPSDVQKTNTSKYVRRTRLASSGVAIEPAKRSTR